MAAVVNVGEDEIWTGHPAGTGQSVRLSDGWPGIRICPRSRSLDEWIGLTFGQDERSPENGQRDADGFVAHLRKLYRAAWRGMDGQSSPPLRSQRRRIRVFPVGNVPLCRLPRNRRRPHRQDRNRIYVAISSSRMRACTRIAGALVRTSCYCSSTMCRIHTN